MLRRSHQWLAAASVAGAALLVVLAWSAGWFFIAGQIRHQVELLALADGESSPQVQCGELDIGGFPFRFDIDCAKADPINTVAALKADPELNTIPTTGFVSHVNTSMIMAARGAGMDEVMARSAFAANLPQILIEKEPQD